jgi:hypothetical protein
MSIPLSLVTFPVNVVAMLDAWKGHVDGSGCTSYHAIISLASCTAFSAPRFAAQCGKVQLGSGLVGLEYGLGVWARKRNVCVCVCVLLISSDFDTKCCDVVCA